MKSLLLSAVALVAVFTTAAQAQTTTGTKAPVNEWFEPAAPASADDDAWGSTPTTAAPAVAETTAEAEPGAYRTGWMSAPGISLSTHQRPTTDYWGRPLKKAKVTKKAAIVAAAPETKVENDPMMRSSGVMVAPGMSSSPYRGVSTDYWGRPLKRKIRRSTASSLAAQPVVAPANADDDTPTSW